MAIANCSLNTTSDLISGMESLLAANVDVAAFLNTEDKEAVLDSGCQVIEAQFQPLQIDGGDKVVVVLKNLEHTSTEFESCQKEGVKYLIIDTDYAGFFRNQRFTSATVALQACGSFPHIAQIKKVYLDNYVLYKEHAVQQFLTGGRVNPQYAPDKVVYTISAGGGSREEIVKYAWKGDVLEYGPFNPAIPELLATPEDKGTVFEFLGRAHFVK